ncbi:MAG: cold shock domain-containing protein [Pseudomonadota bacterium]
MKRAKGVAVTSTDTSLVHGSVKWFDVSRGFGFVVADGVDQDILLHANVLRNFGQSSVADGSAISLRYQQTDRGLQATEVTEISPPEAPDIDDVPVDLEYQPARVKWFDKAKGFGFANVFGRADEDVFVHADTLRRFGLADLLPGEAICIRAMGGARGLLAVEVRRWEFYEG